jgi:hypothetical protein
MITIEDALKDIEVLIADASKEGNAVAVYLLKSQKVLLKFLSTMRTNQLLSEEDKKRISAEKAKRTEKKEIPPATPMPTDGKQGH